MAKYNLPEGMRPAALSEREEFYLNEFNLQEMTKWIRRHPGKPKFAVVIGRHTGIYPSKYQEDVNTTIVIDEYTNWEDLCDQIVSFLPESVYYDRNIYDATDQVKGQELAFDLDPENVTCPIHGTLADKMKRHQGLSFCTTELDIVKSQTVHLYEYLKEQFSKLRIVYSGRGFHIHVFDEDAYVLTAQQRTEIAKKVKTKGFTVDDWVTVGEMRLIRLPYSLHGLASRIVLPLEKKEVASFDPVNDSRCIPVFLQENRVTF